MSSTNNKIAKVAIVILNWNGEHFLRRFISSLVKYSDYPGSEIVVVDNNSTDNSINYLKENHNEIKIIPFEKNYGFALGYHKALKLIEAEYYVLLNSDVEVTTNWLDPIITILDSDKEITAVMPKIKAYNNKESFEYAGAAGGYIDRYGFPFCRGRILSSIETDNGQYDDQREIFWASGACMFVRSSAYHEVEGLDGDFFAHMEEIDLCWRLKKHGYKIWYCPDSVIYHVGGGTLPNNNPRKLYLNYRNSLYLLFKNLPENRFCRTIFKRLMMDSLSALIYLGRFSFSFFFAVVKAHFHFYLSLSTLKIKRNRIKATQRVSDVSMIYYHSIVYNFLVKKKKKFTELPF